jgi:16S rRNA (uracil1498-N3)-methyltransferase
MTLPYFFVDDLSTKKIVLPEDVSRHMISVLRMEVGREILLTDGKGKKAKARIIDDNRKKVGVEVSNIDHSEQKKYKIAIGISLIKNASRFEWFLEKATEIGVSDIFPLLCERTEKEKFRQDRWNSILISAMLQSQQSWLPVLHEPENFSDIVNQESYSKKYIAHCVEGKKQSIEPDHSAIILIGPEGDFTSGEIQLAIQKEFVPVSLGENRLRTETAGIVAATILRISDF